MVVASTLVAAIFNEPDLLGIAAILASISGILTSVLGARRAAREAKDKSDEECISRLRAARLEAEDLAQALHRIRMSRFMEDEDRKAVDDILDRWTHLE